MGKRRRVRLDPYLWARCGLDLARAPYLVARKVRKLWRDPIRHRIEVDLRRWICRVEPRSAATSSASAGPHVVLAGTGYGEWRIIQRLDAALRSARPDVRTTWCGSAEEFFDAARAAAPDHATVRFPFDGLPAVARWLDAVRPDLLVLVENFARPWLITGVASAGVPCIAVNATWWREPLPRGATRGIAALERRRTVEALRQVGFQSEEQVRRAETFLGSRPRARVTGNLKLDVPLPAVSAPAAREVGAWLEVPRERPLLAAASTRRGDEPIVLEAFREARRRLPCDLLLAPREPYRVAKVLELVRAAGLRASRRTRPEAGADVFVLDTVGELPAALAHAGPTFVGGTFRHLGQSIVEPLQLGLPIAFGRAQTLLFEEQVACVEAGLGTWIDGASDLASFWVAAASDPEPRNARMVRSEAFLARHRGALARTLELLLAELDPPRASERAVSPRASRPAPVLAREE